MIDKEVEQNFDIAHFPRKVWRDFVKTAFLGYALNGGDKPIEKMAEDFICLLRLENHFSAETLKREYYNMRQEFILLQKQINGGSSNNS